MKTPKIRFGKFSRRVTPRRCPIRKIVNRILIVAFVCAAVASLSAQSAAELREFQPRNGLPHVLEKLRAGEEVNVAYLGGSITAASGWRVFSQEWLRQQYPTARIQEINAAIAGTGSDFGALRLGNEVLAARPDLLFVEFAVNDDGEAAERIIQGMEGIVRQTWRTNPRTDICFVYTIRERQLPEVQAGGYQATAQAMERVAEHYGIPSIHLGAEVAELERAGKWIFRGPKPLSPDGKPVFSGDGTHPFTETGHRAYLEAIQRAFTTLATEEHPAVRTIPEPLDPANWEDAVQIPFDRIRRVGEWRMLAPSDPITRPLRSISGPFWVAEKPGDSFSFSFRGRLFGFYGLKGADVGQILVQVDDEPPLVTTLFDAFCRGKRHPIRPWVYPRLLSDGEHRVTISIHPDLPDKAAILAGRSGADPVPSGARTAESSDDLEARRLYISHILLLGEFVE